MKSAKTFVLGLSIILMMTAAAPLVFADEAAHIRWDLIHLTTPGATVNPGGQASAMNNIGDTITSTGTGTFVAPSGEKGTSDAVTGGGHWMITLASGGGSSGMYKVTGLVRWE